MKQDKITRRKFVAGTTGAALSAMIVPRHVLGGVGYNAPSDTVNFALIGCGGQGKTDSGELVAGGQNLVALCDVDLGYVDREIARVGAFVRYEWTGGEMSVSGVVAAVDAPPGEREGPASPFGTVTVLTRF